MSEAQVSAQSAPGDSEGALSELIDGLKERVDSGETISIELVQKIAGRRAAGPILLLPALVVMSPLSAIPGVPTVVGLNTILVAGQIVLGREQLWLPKWLTQREVPPKYGRKLLKFLGPLGETADGLVKERANAILRASIKRLGAGICVLVGCVMPVLEVVPFTSTWAGAIIGVYGLAITAKDGFLALAWFGLVVGVACAAWVIFT